jgi:glycosyltransferase involved in cell wall biosynthesis
MESDLPVVAYAAGAVPETLGDAGILLDDKRPSLVASAVGRVRRDPVLADRLVAAGRGRLGQFGAAATRARFVEVLGALPGGQGVDG